VQKASRRVRDGIGRRPTIDDKQPAADDKQPTTDD
jgi:hypothetical protein